MSAGANLHPAGQTENGLSRVPPKAKDRRGLWALHPCGLRAGQSGGAVRGRPVPPQKFEGNGHDGPGRNDEPRRDRRVSGVLDVRYPHRVATRAESPSIPEAIDIRLPELC